ncbi:hypothetical protein GCM10012280_34810 [Wenjunlia tyrosinilytica]|uniref:Aspartate racemase n=1 Tax=Wenjunlia tyrosinilytica TaxID=1544741 RepID=A0A918DZH5_9ACTN|nr:hypothetical protein GCM10012280_34810 [Wenjunlia tyrosinilytica]
MCDSGPMRTIGLLGGMSWESTAEYHRVLNQLTRERLGGLHSVKWVLYSVDFAEIERLQVEGRWEEAGEVLATAAKALESAGADMVLICANTMHKVADQVSASVGIPLVHLADAVADAVRAPGLRRIGLLGTAFTMEQAFHRDRLESHGLDVLTPVAEGRATVHRVIYEDQRHRLWGELAHQGAQEVGLARAGCTDDQPVRHPHQVDDPRRAAFQGPDECGQHADRTRRYQSIGERNRCTSRWPTPSERAWSPANTLRGRYCRPKPS